MELAAGESYAVLTSFFYLGFQLIVFQPDDSTSVTNGEVRQIEIGFTDVQYAI